MPPARVVIADDSQPYRTALREFLRCMPNITVVAAAEDGVEALQLAKELNPDCLILDIEMPRMDGWAVLRRLRHTSIPILVLSSHANSYFKQRALEAGASAYVPKGNIKLLVNTLRQLLDDHTTK